MLKNLISTNMILYCKKWDKTVRFYRDQLQLPINFSTDWFVEFRLNAISRLSIADEKRSSIKSSGGKGVTIALEVEDVEAVQKDMEKTGLKPTMIRKHPWDALVFYLFDPEENRIEIWQTLISNEAPDRNINQT